MENLLNYCIFASYLVKKILLKIIHLYFLTKEIIKGALMHYIITFNKMEDKTHFWWVKKSHFFYIKSLLKISNLISMKVLLQMCELLLYGEKKYCVNPTLDGGGQILPPPGILCSGALNIDLRGPRFWYNSYFIVTM